MPLCAELPDCEKARLAQALIVQVAGLAYQVD